MNDNPDQQANPQPQTQIYIVGIGASAGGLEAIEHLLRHTPSDSGLGYVLIQHLDPSRESGLVDLLRGWTDMTVVEIEDGMQVEPDTFYVIPPNHTIALMHGTLQLMHPPEPHYQWRPIDYFFRSLADDQKEYAISVILSGAGTDGTLGLKAVKGAGGLTIAQSPGTASFASMPNSAIATGLVDLVLPPIQMPDEILAYVDHAIMLRQNPVAVQLDDLNRTWQKVFFLLRSHTGHDFSQYKQTTIQRRVERRMLVNRIDDLQQYVRYLQQQPSEIEILFRDLLIGITQFFREPENFEVLAQKAIRPLIESKTRDESLRIWVNGCSTGEEAYSVAILVHEQMQLLRRQIKVQIFATDINDDAIAKARRGIYEDGIAADVSPERLDRYFEYKDHLYQVNAMIRDTIVFATHNTFQDPPFSNVDLVSCRNLLIYLGSELQEKVIPLLHYALAPGGYLFLGNSETLGQNSRLFKTIDARARLFQRQEVPSTIRPSLNLQSPTVIPYKQNVNLKSVDVRHSADFRRLAEEVLLRNHTPPAVIINSIGDILYFHGRIGKYLEPAAGEANLNLAQMVREGLRPLLANMVRKAVQERKEQIELGVHVRIDTHYEILDVAVRPFAHPDFDNLLLVLFEPASSELLPDDFQERDETDEGMEDSRQRILDLERELQNTREHLQTTVENLEASNEEFKSTNEELHSANEELQSSNEELTSAKEELQSVNEELMTVNSELESKIDELSRANDDLRNLLTSIDIGIIFLDQDLRIVRFNPAATNFLSLRDEDIGRPMAHLVPKLEYTGLVDDAEEVLDTLESKELEVRMESDWYLLRIRPYRTRENIITGVIITFAEITEQKHVQQDLHKLSRAVDQSTDIIIILNVDGSIDYANRRFFMVTGYTSTQIIGQPFHILFAEWRDNSILNKVITSGERWKGELFHQTADQSTFWVKATISPVTDEEGTVIYLFVIEEDITRLKLLEQTWQARWSEDHSPGTEGWQMSMLVFDRNLRYILGERDDLLRIGIREIDLEGPSALTALSSELERYYRAALRGDNVYFERASDNLQFGIQVMPVRDAEGQIIAGAAVMWNITDRHHEGGSGEVAAPDD